MWPGFAFLISIEATLKEQLLMENLITGPAWLVGRKLYGSAVINFSHVLWSDGKVSCRVGKLL